MLTTLSSCWANEFLKTVFKSLETLLAKLSNAILESLNTVSKLYFALCSKFPLNAFLLKLPKASLKVLNAFLVNAILMKPLNVFLKILQVVLKFFFCVPH